MRIERATAWLVYNGETIKPDGVKTWERWRAMVKHIRREYQIQIPIFLPKT